MFTALKVVIYLLIIQYIKCYLIQRRSISSPEESVQFNPFKPPKWILSMLTTKEAKSALKEIIENKNLTRGEVYDQVFDFLKDEDPDLAEKVDKWSEEDLVLYAEMLDKLQTDAMLCDIAKNAIYEILEIRTNMSLTYTEAKNGEMSLYKKLTSNVREDVEDFFKSYNQEIIRKRRDNDDEGQDTFDIDLPVLEAFENLSSEVQEELFARIRNPSLTLGEIIEKIKQFGKEKGPDIEKQINEALEAGEKVEEMIPEQIMSMKASKEVKDVFLKLNEIVTNRNLTISEMTTMFWDTFETLPDDYYDEPSQEEEQADNAR